MTPKSLVRRFEVALEQAATWHRRQGAAGWLCGRQRRFARTSTGTVELRIPKLRKGSYFPGFLERHMAERALTAMVIIGGRPYLWIDANYARFAPDRAHRVGRGECRGRSSTVTAGARRPA